MGRLSPIPPRIASVPGRLASQPLDQPGRDRERNTFNPLRALYNSARWKALRWATLVADEFTCQMCGRVEPDTSKLVADHVKPHRGDLDLFWSGKRQTLCASPCHSKHKQKLEQQADMR